jgi:putative glutamine amidotransferase
MPDLSRFGGAMTPPRIGITGVSRVVQGNERTGVNVAYVSSVLRAGGLPLVLSPLVPAELTGSLADTLDGLLLTGGEDVAPALYGEAPHPALGDVDPRRDQLEAGLLHAARERGIPVLGICRGIQLINAAMGGTLWQDLATQRSDALAHNQQAGRTARTHAVTTTAGTRVAAAARTGTFEVNSFHHQAIKRLAPGLVATATAADGIIEAVESEPGAPWLLAVQWHPEEFHAESVAVDRGLFAALVAAARSRADEASERTPGERAAGRSAG